MLSLGGLLVLVLENQIAQPQAQATGTDTV